MRWYWQLCRHFVGLFQRERKKKNVCSVTNLSSRAATTSWKGFPFSQTDATNILPSEMPIFYLYPNSLSLLSGIFLNPWVSPLLQTKDTLIILLWRSYIWSLVLLGMVLTPQSPCYQEVYNPTGDTLLISALHGGHNLLKYCGHAIM